jgi:hypothetical protein
MDGSAPTSLWTPLKLLKSRLTANLAALETRYPQLAQELSDFDFQQNYQIMPSGESIQLGVGSGLGATPLPHTLPPSAARDVIRKLYPGGVCMQPALIVGEDMGWLWNGIYQLPCNNPAMPGHRSPLFFLIGDLERLWVILHIHEWADLLADPRVRLFVGKDSLEQFRRSLVSESATPWPKISVRVDPTLWSGEPTLDQILADAGAETNETFRGYQDRFGLSYSGTTPESISAMLSSGLPLKVLGITSRFTTFLQHSMRDWLAAFARLGHRTQLFIEEHDHEFCNGLGIAAACAEFQPDLVVVIDHYRMELTGIPAQVPTVMWVQDALPNMFRPEAGAAQGPLDYVLGFARMKMLYEYGYPGDRYMPAVVGCDERRFVRERLTNEEAAKYQCDVSFVSHASATAETLLKAEIERCVPAARLLSSVFEQLRAVYQGGKFITEPTDIRQMIDRALLDTKLSIPESEIPKLMEMFGQRINNALFRHQTLKWVAESGADLRLYGRGWENHPTLARYAHGVADNKSQLSAIYRASKVSLHASPHGGAHQRVMEGLACGGFFMIRRCPGDVMERHFHTIWNWCVANDVVSDSQLKKCTDPQIIAALAQSADALQLDPFTLKPSFLETLRSSAQCGYIRSAGMIWNEDYDGVSFGSAGELTQKLKRFLANDAERLRTAESMREVVLERFTYLATTKRFLRLSADDVDGRVRQKAAA